MKLKYMIQHNREPDKNHAAGISRKWLKVDSQHQFSCIDEKLFLIL